MFSFEKSGTWDRNALPNDPASEFGLATHFLANNNVPYVIRFPIYCIVQCVQFTGHADKKRNPVCAAGCAQRFANVPNGRRSVSFRLKFYPLRPSTTPPPNVPIVEYVFDLSFTKIRIGLQRECVLCSIPDSVIG